MTALRRLPAASYSALKTGTRHLVESLGGFQAAAGFTRVKSTRLHNYCDQHSPDEFAPIDVIADLQDVERNPVLVCRLAQLVGHEVVLIQALAEGCEARAVAQVLRDAADLAASWVEALSDARLTDEERAYVLTRLGALRRAVDQATAMLTGQITTAGQRRLGLVG